METWEEKPPLKPRSLWSKWYLINDKLWSGEGREERGGDKVTQVSWKNFHIQLVFLSRKSNKRQFSSWAELLKGLMERRGDFLGQLVGYLWFCYLLLEYLRVSLSFWVIVPCWKPGWELSPRASYRGLCITGWGTTWPSHSLPTLSFYEPPCSCCWKLLGFRRVMVFSSLHGGEPAGRGGNRVRKWRTVSLRSGSQTSVWKEGRLNLHLLAHITGSVILWGHQGASSWVWSY